MSAKNQIQIIHNFNSTCKIHQNRCRWRWERCPSHSGSSQTTPTRSLPALSSPSCLLCQAKRGLTWRYSPTSPVWPRWPARRPSRCWSRRSARPTRTSSSLSSTGWRRTSLRERFTWLEEADQRSRHQTSVELDCCRTRIPTWYPTWRSPSCPSYRRGTSPAPPPAPPPRHKIITTINSQRLGRRSVRYFLKIVKM